jgi:hypothetical protein
MMNYPSKQFCRSFANDELFCKNIFDVATIIEHGFNGPFDVY